VLASGGSLGEVRLWDALRRRELGQPLRGAPDDLRGLTFSPDGRRLAVCGGAAIVLWDLQERSVLDTIRVNSPNRCRAGFAAGGRQLVFAAGGSIITWDIGRRRAPRADPVPSVSDGPAEGGEDQEKPTVTSFTPSPDGTKALVMSDQVDPPMLWDLRRGTRLASLPEDVHFVNEVTFSQNGRALAIATDTSTQIVQVAGLVPGRILSGHKGDVLSAALSPDGRTLAAGGEDGTIALFQADSLGALPVSPLDAAFRGDGGQLLTASFEEGMQAWDVAAGKATATLSAPPGRPDSNTSFTADGHRLAVAADGPEGTILLWDIADEPPAEPWAEGNNDWANPAFSPDGRWLAVDSSSGVELWDVQARRPVTTLARHSDAVFSPDSRFLATSVGTSEVAVLRVADLARIATLDAGVPSDALRFSPDSQLLATSGDGVSLQRFDAPWAERHVCGLVGRELTRQEWKDHVRGRDYQPVCS
jgi:WD40 repeat protein